MFREAIIPEVNDGKPFEAYGIEVKQEGKALISLSRKGLFVTVIRVDEIEQMEERKASLQWQLAQALNPPIKVTQAVLDAMEKVPEAKYRIHLGRFTQSLSKANSSKGICFYHYKIYTDLDNVDIFEEESHKKLLLEVGNYIQADCPLALQVLLGFTTEGVPKDV
jgi:hypothetical protein